MTVLTFESSVVLLGCASYSLVYCYVRRADGEFVSAVADVSEVVSSLCSRSSEMTEAYVVVPLWVSGVL